MIVHSQSTIDKIMLIIGAASTEHVSLGGKEKQGLFCKLVHTVGY